MVSIKNLNAISLAFCYCVSYKIFSCSRGVLGADQHGASPRGAIHDSWAVDVTVRAQTSGQADGVRREIGGGERVIIAVAVVVEAGLAILILPLEADEAVVKHRLFLSLTISN